MKITVVSAFQLSDRIDRAGLSGVHVNGFTVSRDDMFVYAVIRRPTYWVGFFFFPVMRGEAPR